MSVAIQECHLAPRPKGDDTGFNQDQAAAAFRDFLGALGLDLNDPNLTGTEQRVARAYQEILGGLRPGAEPRLSTFANTPRYTDWVTVTSIPFYSLCAHHFLPFFGTACVGYVPGKRLAGLSKLPRIVEYYARRPQLQELLTEQIATYLYQRLEPAGVIVVIEARHLCMEMRGISRPGLTTRTRAVRGILDKDQQQRFSVGLHPGAEAEFLQEVYI